LTSLVAIPVAPLFHESSVSGAYTLLYVAGFFIPVMNVSYFLWNAIWFLLGKL